MGVRVDIWEEGSMAKDLLGFGKKMVKFERYYRLGIGGMWIFLLFHKGWAKG